MLNTVIFEPFIRVKKHNRHNSPNSSRVSENTKLIHYTDPIFETPLLQIWLADEECIYIHTRKTFKAHSVYNPWTTGFIYWKERKKTTQRCKACKRVLPITSFTERKDRDAYGVECLKCYGKKGKARSMM